VPRHSVTTTKSTRARDEVSHAQHPLKPDTKPLSKSVRRGAIWSVASAAQLRLVSVITTAVVAHILDPKDFGIFAVAMTVYAIVFSVGELGVGSCLARADLDVEALAPTMVTISVITSAIQAGAMFFFAKPIASALGSPGAEDPIKAMALVVMIVGIFAVPTARLMRDFRQDRVFLAEAFSVVVSTVVLLLLAKDGSGAMAFAYSRVAGQFVSGCVVFASAPKNYRPGLTRNGISVLYRYGLPLGFATFVSYVLLNVDYALIGHLLGAVALGTYVLAFNVASWPASLLGFMINNVSMPAFSRVKDDSDRLAKAMASALRALSLVVMPMSALTMALARPIVLTLYGAKWQASASILSILTLYGAISIVCLLFANMLAGLGRSRLLLIIQLAWISILLPAMTIGVRQDGIQGAAFAHIVVIAPIVLPVYLFSLRRATGIRLWNFVQAAWCPVLASLVAAIAARDLASYFTKPLLQLIVGLAVGGLIYMVLVAPQAIGLINTDHAAKIHGRRILRFYNNAARLAGLPGGSAPRHAAKGRRYADLEQANDRTDIAELDPRLDSAAASQPDDAAQLAALDLLLSLSRPVPMTRAPVSIGRPV
jgi:lipopolysaccharide exporter